MAGEAVKGTIYLLASTSDPQKMVRGGHRNNLFYLALKDKVKAKLVGIQDIPKVIVEPGDVLWFFGVPHPQINQMLFYGQEHGAKVIYDMIDDWDSMGWSDKAAEKELLQRADLVYVVSPILEERCKALRSQGGVWLIPNAFLPAYAPCRRKPKNKDYISIGSAGKKSLESFVHFHADICRYPEVVMWTPGDPLSGLGYAELNTFLKEGDFKVGLAFYENTLHNWAGSPLKFYNYLYHGIKVWSETALSGWENIPNVYFLPFTPENALKIISAPFIPMSDQWLSSNTFQSRVDDALRSFAS
jgi:hypothetical protein